MGAGPAVDLGCLAGFYFTRRQQALMTTGAIRLIAALAIASTACAHSTAPVDHLSARTQSADPLIRPRLLGPTPSAIHGDATTSIAVRRLRLESAPPIDTVPSVNLKFELLNVGPDRLADIVIEISIVEAKQPNDTTAREEVLAGPFTVRGKVTLEPGGVMKYDMRFRNLTRDCGCRPAVVVVSVRRVGDRQTAARAPV
jgi:hypothetical protein